MAYYSCADTRKIYEYKILNSIKRQTAQGALYQLIFNVLMQEQRHLRASILELCRRQGYSAGKTTDALSLMEMADWVHNQTDGLEVVLFLTEHAKLTGGADV